MHYKTAIVGAQGYTGLELAKLLSAHPCAKLDAVFSRDPNWELQTDPAIGYEIMAPTYPLATLADHAHQFDCIFLATPAAVSMEIASHLQTTAAHIIDLSGAFRLPAQEYTKWYGEEHYAPSLINKAHYGLCPWWALPVTTDVHLISNPGCYATNALMILIPLLQHKLITPDTIVIDAKSGVSGAGRKADTQLLYGEIADNFYPYKIGQHQHTPEIVHYLHLFSGQHCTLLLTTQLLPIKRGLAVSIYTRPQSNYTDNDLEHAVSEAYTQAYQNYPLARHQPLSTLSPMQIRQMTSLQTVSGTPYIHITYKAQNNWLMLFGMLDNLMKGAASQAIENFNRLFKLPITCGLLQASRS